MRLRSFLWIAAAFIFTPLSYADVTANKHQNIEDLRANIETYSNNYFRNVYGEETFSRDVRVHVSQLDKRLRLNDCSDNISFELIRPAHHSRNLTVKTICQGAKPWSIYVPITLEVYADIVVASRNLKRGIIVSDADIDIQRVNTANLPLGHVVDKARVVGMELRRNVRTGGYLLLSSVEKPRVIAKGDSVLMESRQSSLMVATKGTALNHGQVGEQISVQNNQSERIVKALVTGPGRVSVVSR